MSLEPFAVVGVRSRSVILGKVETESERDVGQSDEVYEAITRSFGVAGHSPIMHLSVFINSAHNFHVPWHGAAVCSHNLHILWKRTASVCQTELDRTILTMASLGPNPPAVNTPIANPPIQAQPASIAPNPIHAIRSLVSSPSRTPVGTTQAMKNAVKDMRKNGPVWWDGVLPQLAGIKIDELTHHHGKSFYHVTVPRVPLDG